MSITVSRRLLRAAPIVVSLLVLAGLVFADPLRDILADFTQDEPDDLRPPLTPRWAYEPWVWEDEENTVEATVALVDDYRRHDIPVGAVIVDSPWQTNYNTFEAASSFGSLETLVSRLRDRNVRIIFWATGFINVSSIDGPDEGQAANYQEAYERGYFVDGGKTYEWDKGEGSAIDFFNPDAVAWWYGQMDKTWAYGIDGWKVDAPEGNLPDMVQTAAGWKTNREYGYAYYRAFYTYVAQKSPDAIITARPIDGGTVYATVDANPAGWVGDQEPDWGPKGIEEALDNILASAEAGYSMLGSDIGGYRPGERLTKLFVRWTQLGALSPLMENGGRGEHRPWLIDDEAVAPYRYYAKLHSQLVPYLYGLGVEAHETGQPIIRDPDREERQYRLGDDLFVAPVVTRDDKRRITLPSGSRWYDYWDDQRIIPGGTSFEYDVPAERMALYVRAGAIIPMAVSDALTGHGNIQSADALTLVLYPDGVTRRLLRPKAGQQLAVESRREGNEVTIALGPFPERLILRIKAPARPASVELRTDAAATPLAEIDSFGRLQQQDAGWVHEGTRGYLWVRLPSSTAAVTVTYREP